MNDAEFVGQKILGRIKYQIYEEYRNWLALCVGKVGTGKSSLAISISSKIDKNFSLENIVFSEQEFMDAIRKLPVGSFVVPDEIGSWMGNRDYMTNTNKLLSYVLQTFRFKRLGILWTVPLNRQADVNIRNMADATFETVKNDRYNKFVVAKLKYVEVNPMSVLEPYRKFPKIRMSDGIKTINSLKVGWIDKGFWDAYEDKKAKHMEKLYKHIHDKFDENGTDSDDKEEKNDGRLVRCNKCGWKFNTKSMRPRCSRCASSIVVDAHGKNI